MSNVERKISIATAKVVKKIEIIIIIHFFFASFDKNDYLCRKISGKSV